ncbi:hypothetical protein PCANC_12361 [Puccinia coronata f. sp. avenae]|uniref:RAVE complex protein Rav1 C-terminal domain-containing protein n=1 Tax=Puccinia coronata f. sp. avenae TaxID=200324 RepID=A0A2N5V3V3_9BASI|nr:hypothetical protein PCANC_12361 [Puccinia coronata f. sp. avenae]
MSGGGGGDTAWLLDKLGGTSHGAMEQDRATCSLFYLALSKKRLLVDLWNVAYGHANWPLMNKFLQNDFSQSRWKTAAQKNAFGLLGRQRFCFAASFFLLADWLQDAVNVCMRQLGDWQLAVAIVRAYEGDWGAAMDKLLTTAVLPLGFLSGNRWLVSWGFRMLGEVELACRVLVVRFSHSSLNKRRIEPLGGLAQVHQRRQLQGVRRVECSRSSPLTTPAPSGSRSLTTTATSALTSDAFVARLVGCLW